jgi:hypothetical protein
MVTYHCDVRSLTGFDRLQPDAGCNERKGFDHRAHCVEFTIVAGGELLLTTRQRVARLRRAMGTGNAAVPFALWTRNCCNVQTRMAQRSCPDDDYRFPGPCL